MRQKRHKIHKERILGQDEDEELEPLWNEASNSRQLRSLA